MKLTHERVMWGAALVFVAILSGGTAYAVAAPGEYNCVKTDRADGFALDCVVSVAPSPTASPKPTLTPSPEPTTPPPPTTSPPVTPPPMTFPTPQTAGVPPFTALTAYAGPCTITAANTVIDAKLVTCAPLTIATTGVKITRSRLDGGVVTGRGNAANQPVKLTVEDSDLLGHGSTRGIDGSAYVVRRSELRGESSGGWCWRQCEISDSYFEAAGSHSSAFRVQRDGVLRHNTFWCKRAISDTDGGCSGDLVSYPDVIDGQQTVIDNNVVTGNLIKATPGWFCLRAGNGTGWTVTGNTFERGAGNCSEQAGGAAVTNWTGGTWSDNVFVGGGTVTP